MEIPENIQLMINASRSHLVDFEIATNKLYQPNWHHEEIAKELENIEKNGDRDYKILILSVPPRHGKSQQCSIDFPSWYLGKNPSKEIITASYSAELAQDFGGKTREKMNGDAYRLIFQEVSLREDEQARGHFRTKQGGGYTAVGVGGPLTGKGANILLIDDPVKNREEAESDLQRKKIFDWFTSTAFTRLEPKGVVILIMTRWHSEDLAGQILKNKEIKDRVKVINFMAITDEKALWPEKYPVGALEETKKNIGPYDFAALYQGSPVLSETQEFKPEWIKTVEDLTAGIINTRRFLTIDTAMSKKSHADFTGFCDNSVDINNYWYLRAWHQRLSPEELVDMLFTLHLTNRYEAIGIEKTTFTEGLKPYLDTEQRRRNKFLPIVELKHNQTAKETRIRGLIPRYASGSIFHIDGQCKELEQELFSFPMGSHDDVCLVGETQILTSSGNKSIKDIQAGEMVMTRQGYKKVLRSWQTGIKPVITNLGITGTAEHPVITKNGVIHLQYANESDTIYTWNQQLLSIEEKSIGELRIQLAETKGFITGAMTNGTSLLFRFIDKNISTIMGQSQKVLSFITKTAIHLITILKTYKLYLEELINLIINKTQLQPYLNIGKAEKSKKTWTKSDFSQKNGIGQRWAWNGIGNTPSTRLWVNQLEEYVWNVIQNMRQGLSKKQNSVQGNVILGQAQESLGLKTPIITRSQKVYNLEIEGVHEFFANGVLVHNCDATAYMLQIADQPYAVKNGEVSVFYSDY